MPTFNRYAVLRDTLEAMCKIDRQGIDCNLVVIDNNSTDCTSEVVSEYKERFPLTLLKEPRPGKNCALNKALREHPLRDIVVFTDDDVIPDKSWLQEMVSCTRRWQNISVFGGRIRLKWPNDERPQWAAANWLAVLGYCSHDLGNEERLYAPPACPFGANFWVRKEIFEQVPSFDETIGPRPTDRIIGSETSFLMELQRRGFQMLYCPSVQIHHRVLPNECAIPALRRRGYRFGRGQVRLFGWHRREIYVKNKLFWLILMLADYIYTSGRYVVGVIQRDLRRNCEITVASMIRFGSLYQTFKEFKTSLKPAGRSEICLPGQRVG
jgi:cellulose synthase/poly-beta-1,6-N-acetylglucosamine synthase-like glycosyltransferase